MREMSSSGWLRRGSSIVYDSSQLQSLIEQSSMVSLRQVLNWMDDWPVEPPHGHDTVLVAGLDTCLQLLSAADSVSFVKSRIKPFVQEFQTKWDQRGLVFGFSCSPKCFRIDNQDRVLFKPQGGEEIILSAALWNGAATHDIYMLTDSDKNDQQPLGFYVRRMS